MNETDAERLFLVGGLLAVVVVIDLLAAANLRGLVYVVSLFAAGYMLSLSTRKRPNPNTNPNTNPNPEAQ